MKKKKASGSPLRTARKALCFFLMLSVFCMTLPGSISALAPAASFAEGDVHDVTTEETSDTTETPENLTNNTEVLSTTEEDDLNTDEEEDDGEEEEDEANDLTSEDDSEDEETTELSSSSEEEENENEENVEIELDGDSEDEQGEEDGNEATAGNDLDELSGDEDSENVDAELNTEEKSTQDVENPDEIGQSEDAGFTALSVPEEGGIEEAVQPEINVQENQTNRITSLAGVNAVAASTGVSTFENINTTNSITRRSDFSITSTDTIYDAIATSVAKSIESAVQNAISSSETLTSLNGLAAIVELSDNAAGYDVGGTGVGNSTIALDDIMKDAVLSGLDATIQGYLSTQNLWTNYAFDGLDLTIAAQTSSSGVKINGDMNLVLTDANNVSVNLTNLDQDTGDSITVTDAANVTYSTTKSVQVDQSTSISGPTASDVNHLVINNTGSHQTENLTVTAGGSLTSSNLSADGNLTLSAVTSINSENLHAGKDITVSGKSDSFPATVEINGNITSDGGSVQIRSRVDTLMVTGDVKAQTGSINLAARTSIETGALLADGSLVVGGSDSGSLADVIINGAVTSNARGVKLDTNLNTLTIGGETTAAESIDLAAKTAISTKALNAGSAIVVSGTDGLMPAEVTIAGAVTSNTGNIKMHENLDTLKITGPVTTHQEAISLAALTSIETGMLQANKAINVSGSTGAQASVTINGSITSDTGNINIHENLAQSITLEGTIKATHGSVTLTSVKSQGDLGIIGRTNITTGSLEAIGNIFVAGLDPDLTTVLIAGNVTSDTGYILMDQNIDSIEITGAATSIQSYINLAAKTSIETGALASHTYLVVKGTDNARRATAIIHGNISSSTKGIEINENLVSLNVAGSIASDLYISLAARTSIETGSMTANGVIVVKGTDSVNRAGVTINGSVTSRNDNVKMIDSLDTLNVSGAMTASQGKIDLTARTSIDTYALSARGNITVAGTNGAASTAVTLRGPVSSSNGDVIANTNINAIRTAGSVTALQGSILLTSGTSITTQGPLNAGGNISANATNNISIGGLVSAGGNVSLASTQGGIQAASGAVVSGANVILSAAQNIGSASNRLSIGQTGNLSVYASNAYLNGAGVITVGTSVLSGRFDLETKYALHSGPVNEKTMAGVIRAQTLRIASTTGVGSESNPITVYVPGLLFNEGPFTHSFISNLYTPPENNSGSGSGTTGGDGTEVFPFYTNTASAATGAETTSVTSATQRTASSNLFTIEDSSIPLAGLENIDPNLFTYTPWKEFPMFVAGNTIHEGAILSADKVTESEDELLQWLLNSPLHMDTFLLSLGEEDGEAMFDESLTICINVGEELEGRTLRVLYEDPSEGYKLIECVVENGWIVFTVSKIGMFMLLEDWDALEFMPYTVSPASLPYMRLMPEKQLPVRAMLTDARMFGLLNALPTIGARVV